MTNNQLPFENQALLNIPVATEKTYLLNFFMVDPIVDF